MIWVYESSLYRYARLFGIQDTLTIGKIYEAKLIREGKMYKILNDNKLYSWYFTGYFIKLEDNRENKLKLLGI